MTLPEDYINRPVRSLQTMLQVLSNVFPALLTVNPDGIYGETTQKRSVRSSAFRVFPRRGSPSRKPGTRLQAAIFATRRVSLPPEPLRIVLQPGQEISPANRICIFI